jgi:hypothetical protein
MGSESLKLHRLSAFEKLLGRHQYIEVSISTNLDYSLIRPAHQLALLEEDRYDNEENCTVASDLPAGQQ